VVFGATALIISANRAWMPGVTWARPSRSALTIWRAARVASRTATPRAR
jgi:hypothetical protein